MSTLKVVQSNTAPGYQITCQRKDGTVIVLTNTTVTLKLTQGGVQTNTGHEACTIINAALGIVSWQPSEGDLANPGNYLGDVKVTYSDASHEILYGQLKLSARAAL